jgi:hypothetical protein
MQPDDAHRSGPYFIILYYSMYRTLNSSDIFLMGLKGQQKGRSLEASFTVNTLCDFLQLCIPPSSPSPSLPPPCATVGPSVRSTWPALSPFRRTECVRHCDANTQEERRGQRGGKRVREELSSCTEDFRHRGERLGGRKGRQLFHAIRPKEGSCVFFFPPASIHSCHR